MACSASVGSQRLRANRFLCAGKKAGLYLGFLSLATALTPLFPVHALAAAGIPPRNPIRPVIPTSGLIADCFRQAREAEQSTLDWQHRVSSLLAIGRAHLIAGDAAGARATALDALQQIPADAGNPEDVGSNIGFTDGMPLKGVVAEAIELLAQSGDPAGALRAADRLRDGEDRAETLLTVADVYAASHDLPSAKFALNEAGKSGFVIHDDSDRGETLSRIAAAWQRIDPQEMPSSLVSDASAALRDATNAWGWGRSPVKLTNRRWQATGDLSFPARVYKAYMRMGAMNEASRSVQQFEAHGFAFTSKDSLLLQAVTTDTNSVLHCPDLVPHKAEWLKVKFAYPGSYVESDLNDESSHSNFADLLNASQGSDSWTIAATVTKISEQPWSTLSDSERRLIQQVRSDLIGRAGQLVAGIDRAFLLCAAARLDLLIGDREDARGLIGQATGLFDTSASTSDSTSSAARQMMRKAFPQTSAERDREIHGVLLLRLADSLCALGDFSGAARLVDEKGGPYQCVILQKIAYHAADARSARRAMTISAEVEMPYGTITANQTLNGVANRLIRQHDWDDAHQAAMSIKDPSARVHALCLLIDGYYGRASAY